MAKKVIGSPLLLVFSFGIVFVLLVIDHVAMCLMQTCTLILKVDLECSRCSKKIKKTLCKLQGTYVAILRGHGSYVKR